MLLGQFQLCTLEDASVVLENPREAALQIEHTGRILLPDYLLQRLAACQPPFLFRLTAGCNSVHLGYPVFCSFRAAASPSLGRSCVIVPSWAASQLKGSRTNKAPPVDSSDAGLESAGLMWVTLSVETLPIGSFIRLRPLQSNEVWGWANPTATLNKKLREFACLTLGSVFSILYLDRSVYFEIKSLKPAPAVCIIDCDMQLEFDFEARPEDDTSADYCNSQDEKDAVLNEEQLHKCGVKSLAVSTAATSMAASLRSPSSSEALLRDALARARTAANASARRWGSGVALATGLEVTAPAASTFAPGLPVAAASSTPMPNLSFEWGALTFSRPAGRYEAIRKPSSADPQKAPAIVGIQGKGVRLKDSATS